MIIIEDVSQSSRFKKHRLITYYNYADFYTTDMAFNNCESDDIKVVLFFRMQWKYSWFVNKFIFITFRNSFFYIS